MMGTGSGARPAAVSRERKQPKAAPAPAGRRGGAGSWNKSQEGLPGSSWSGLQRMEAGNGKGEGGRGMRRGFLRPRPRSSCAGGPGTSATLAQHCHADMGGWRLCAASGLTCGWHRESGDLEGTQLQPGQKQPKFGGPGHWWGPSLTRGVRAAFQPVPECGVGCCGFWGAGRTPSPITQHRQPRGPSAAWRPCPVWSRRGGGGRGL